MIYRIYENYYQVYLRPKYKLTKASTITNITKLGKISALFTFKSYPLLKKNGCLINISPTTKIKQNIIALYVESFIIIKLDYFYPKLYYFRLLL